VLHSLYSCQYRAYFSAAYRELKTAVAEALERVRRMHGGDVHAGFERAVRVVGERRAFWSRFCDVPEVQIDTARVVRAWNAARDAVVAALNAKQAAPLERHALDQGARNAIVAYDGLKQEVSNLSDALVAANDRIRVVQEQAAGADPQTIAQDFARLRATKNRHAPEIAALCNAYLEEKEAKARTEAERAEARAALDECRASVIG
jgi:hypothetical protein